MNDRADREGSTRSQGCLATGVGGVVLVLLAPFMVAVRSWKKWRRGSEIQSEFTIEPLTNPVGANLSLFDLKLDVPLLVEPEFRRRLTDAVVRVAEALRTPDDVYHLVYRLPWDEEPLAMPVGPKVQELGERFALVQAQGAMAGRTAVWLTLGRDRALAEVLDPVAYDPEAEGEPQTLLIHADLRWSMATEWARIGPSLIFRLILVAPARAEEPVKALLASIG